MYFLNISNHPSSAWSENQRYSAEKYGTIVDVPFPQIDPDGDEQYISELKDRLCKNLYSAFGKEGYIVHIMGEMSLTFAVVSCLRKEGIRCFVSTTERNTIDNGDGTKTVSFDFVRFREYMF